MKKNIKKLLMATLPGIIIPISMVANSCGSDSADLWFITDSGNVNDQSFNQQSYEAIQNVSKEFDMTNKYIKPADTAPTTFIGAYKTAMSNGAKALVLSGFQQGTAASTFYASADNKPLFQNVHTYFVDGDLGADTGGATSDNFTSIEFKAEQSGFLAGYTIAKWMTENNKGTNVATYGGLKYQTVFGYMNGFDYGIGAYNFKHKSSNEIHELAYTSGKSGETYIPEYDVTRTDFTHAPIDSFQSGNYSGNFLPGGLNNSATLISNDFINRDAKVILPVAGPQTQDTINAIKQSQKQGVYVLGVDTPNELRYTDVQQYILGSALKNISTAVTSALENQFKTHLSSDKWCTAANGVYNEDNFTCEGGFNSDATKSWVGMSINQLNSDKGTLTTDLNEAIVVLNSIPKTVDLLDGIYGSTHTTR